MLKICTKILTLYQNHVLYQKIQMLICHDYTINKKSNTSFHGALL